MNILCNHYYSWDTNFLLISWVQSNHEFKCSTKYTFSIGLYADFCKTTKSNIHKTSIFPKSMKFGPQENIWIHSTLQAGQGLTLTCIFLVRLFLIIIMMSMPFCCQMIFTKDVDFFRFSTSLRKHIQNLSKISRVKKYHHIYKAWTVDNGYFYIYKPQKLLINFEVVDVEKQKWFVKNYCR